MIILELALQRLTWIFAALVGVLIAAAFMALAWGIWP